MDRILLCQKMGASAQIAVAALRRAGLALALVCAGVGITHAATVTNHLTWSVTNTPNTPATHFRVEKDMGGTWTPLATVPAPQMTHDDVGLAPGIYSYRIVPMANGMDGTPSNTTMCGAVPTDATVSLTCAPEVIQ